MTIKKRPLRFWPAAKQALRGRAAHSEAEAKQRLPAAQSASKDDKD